MSVNEAIARLVRGRLLLMLVCLLTPPLLVLALYDARPQWTASSRVQLPGAAAASNVQADAVSTHADAVATTPAMVRDALRAAGRTDDPVQYALDHVDVTRLGQSTVVEVDVTDSSARVAGTVAESLARQVVDFLNASQDGSVQQAVAAIDAQVKPLDAKQQDLVSKLTGSPLNERAPTWQSELASVQRQLGDLASQRQTLVTQQALQPRAELVDGATTQLVPSLRPKLLAFSGVVGLLLAMLALAVAEMLSPTVGGVRPLARELETPVVGRLRRRDLNHETDLHELRLTLSMLARRHDLDRLLLLPLSRSHGRVVDDVARRLGGSAVPEGFGVDALDTDDFDADPATGLRHPSAPRAQEGPVAHARQVDAAMLVRDRAVESPGGLVEWRRLETGSWVDEAGAGVVLLATDRTRRRWLEHLRDRLAVSGATLLGIVAVPVHANWLVWWRPAPRPPVEEPAVEAVASADLAIPEQAPVVRSDKQRDKVTP